MGHGGKHRSGHGTAAGHKPGHQVQSSGDLGNLARSAQSCLVHQIGGAKGMQTGQCLQWRPLPNPDQTRRSALQRLPDPERTGEHGILLTRCLLESDTTAVQCGR